MKVRRLLVSLGLIVLAAFAYYWLVLPEIAPVVPDNRTSQSAPPASSSKPERSAPGSALPKMSASPKFDDDVVRSAAPSVKVEAAVEVERKARAFVEKLTLPVNSSLSVAKADHFVSGAQTIELNSAELNSAELNSAELDSAKVIDELRLSDLTLDANLGPDTPITLVKQISQIDLSTPEKLIADSGGDLERKIQVLLEDEVQTLSVREALARHSHAPDEPISVIKVIEYLEPTTLAELTADANRGGGAGWDDMIRVIKGSYRPQSMSVADLLAGIQGVEKDSVFYVHSVRPSDSQGVWGIIHRGLIENFARGMAVRRGEALDTFRVEIPRDADERQTDNSSSYLGRLIDEKTRGSAVYNFRAGRMTRNPDLIVPGKEIVIINFSPEELVGIYRHFLGRRANVS